MLKKSRKITTGGKNTKKVDISIQADELNWIVGDFLQVEIFNSIKEMKEVKFPVVVISKYEIAFEFMRCGYCRERKEQDEHLKQNSPSD
jgi:hypothetical protein